MELQQNFNDDTLYNEALQIQQDFTELEQLKIAKNLISLVCNDIYQNIETEKEEKTFIDLMTIFSQLKKIIETYDKGE